MPRQPFPEDVDFFLKEASLDKKAPWRDIKDAYKKLALQYHPDRVRLDDSNPGKAALIAEYEEIFKKISNGYERLYTIHHPQSTNADYSEVPFKDEIDPNALVPEDGLIRVFLPIYVLKTANLKVFTFLDVSVTAAELDSPARFAFLLKRCNESLKRQRHQVGLDLVETEVIINQQPYYKESQLSFIGALELRIPFTAINLTEGEGWNKPTPYFWIKLGTEIAIQNTCSFAPVINPDIENNMRITDVMKTLQRKFVPTEKETPLIATTEQFNFNQALNTKELIAEALLHYRTEYEESVKYNLIYQDALDNIIEMQALHSSAVSNKKKIEPVQQQKAKYGGRFRTILTAMEEYYKANTDPVLEENKHHQVPSEAEKRPLPAQPENSDDLRVSNNEDTYPFDPNWKAPVLNAMQAAIDGLGSKWFGGKNEFKQGKDKKRLELERLKGVFQEIDPKSETNTAIKTVLSQFWDLSAKPRGRFELFSASYGETHSARAFKASINKCKLSTLKTYMTTITMGPPKNQEEQYFPPSRPC